MKRTFVSIFVLLIFINITSAQENNKSEKEFISSENILKDAPYNIELVEIHAGILKTKAGYLSHAKDIHIESFYMDC